MKRTTRILAVILTFMMVFALQTPVNAAERAAVATLDKEVEAVTMMSNITTKNFAPYYKYDKDDEIELNSLESSKTEIYALFNNLKKENYTLPETGGIGTNRFTAMGLALMAGSLMCGYVMRRKRREGRRN